MGGRATSADVARRAGVSRATVSYVLNDRPGHSISAPTREKVRAAAEELGYIPNHSARALRGKVPPVILVVTHDMPFGRNVGDMMDAFAALAAGAGFSLVSLRSEDHRALETTVVHLHPRLVIATLPVPEEDLRVLARLDAPIVDGWALQGEVVGGEQASALQVRRLADAGRRRLAYLGATEQSLALFDAGRREGVRRTCEELGLPAPVEAAIPMVVEAEGIVPVQEILRGWLALEEPVDAVACYNDFWAAALLRAARAEGIAVPSELSVIGIDDEPMSAFLDPPLTTIDYDARGLARMLFARGLEMIGESPLDASADAAGASAADGANASTADGASAIVSPRFRVIERGSV
ncbi:LacI family DNA-binding transcriptional regulator [Brachybacterium sp. DNPG3]